MSRELPPLEPRPFRTPAGISGAVEAAAAPESKASEGSEEITIPIGTGQPITCSAYTERIDPGSSLWRVAENVKKKLTLAAFQLTDVVAVDGTPLVLAVAVYQAPSEKGPMVGLLKLGLYAHDARSLLCVHDEPGYKETFDRIMKGLAASLKGGGTDARAGAAYAEVSVMRLGELPIGFSERTVSAREGGGRTLQEYSSQLVPRGPGELMAADRYAREEVDAKDLLEKGIYVHATGGALDTQIALTRQEDGKTYAYEGEKEGKKLSGKLRTKAGFSTELWFARRLAGTAPVPKKPLVHEAYSHVASPTAALPISFAAVGAAPRRAAMKIGPLQMEGDLDANGLFETAEMPVGAAKIVIRRIFSRGAP